MKNLLLLSVLLTVLFSFNSTAQVICYGEESKETDFWLDHYYYAKCTDYIGTGFGLFGGNMDYVDFSAGSSIDFTDIYVSKDGDYTAVMTYGMGWIDVDGALLDLNLNGTFWDELLLPPTPEGQSLTLEFEVELWEDYNNVIQLVNKKDWPVILGFQLTRNDDGTSITDITESSFTVFSNNGILTIDNLRGSNNTIRINTMDGKLIKSETTHSSSYKVSLPTGLYIINVNGEVAKMFVK